LGKKLIAWLKLLRLPNVFTAAADVMMGFLVTHGNLEPAWQVVLLVVSSCLLYLSGMVLNDVFDAEVDACEQPHRPIPSGKISRRSARNVGWAMMLSGVLVAWCLSITADDGRPAAVATLLAICIVLYDAVLKGTPIAPIGMGACRAWNVVLGMSLGFVQASLDWHVSEILIVAGLGVYVTGVTLFSSTDANVSSRAPLISGLVILLAGLAVLATIPAIATNLALVVRREGWYFLWAVLALITTRRCVLAIMQPTSQRVQAAVRHCVQSIIVLDAAVCVGFAGPFWGLVVLLLLFPTLLLTMWLDTT
jgi:4-hydroxybenzoate polyprenyltransferase